MNEFNQLLIESAAGTLSLLLGFLHQRRASRRSREQAAQPSSTTALRSIGVQLDAIDAEIEAQTEPAMRECREDDRWRQQIRQTLLDIDDLAALIEPPRARYEEPFETTPIAATIAEVLNELESSPGERARVFMSTGRNFNGSGQSFSFLIVGNRGRKLFTIASGATQASIITAANQFNLVTGMYASQDNVNPNLIRMVSLRRGPNQYVAAVRLGGAHLSVFYDENRANPAERQFDFGA